MHKILSKIIETIMCNILNNMIGIANFFPQRFAIITSP